MSTIAGHSYDAVNEFFISQKPTGVGGKVGPVSPKDDIEAPCINQIEQVYTDIKQLAGKLGGEVEGFEREQGKRFRGARITTDGSSFQFYERSLRELGFGDNDSLNHLNEGKGLQMKFMDNLWYHVIIKYPDPNAVNAFGEPLNPSAPTPGLTIHCHATDPSGGAHLWDTIRRSIW